MRDITMVYKVAKRASVKGISEHNTIEAAMESKNKAGSGYHVYRFGNLASKKKSTDRWMMWKK